MVVSGSRFCAQVCLLNNFVAILFLRYSCNLAGQSGCMSYIKVIAWLPKIYGNVNKPLGLFYYHKSRYNYYLNLVFLFHNGFITFKFSDFDKVSNSQ